MRKLKNKLAYRNTCKACISAYMKQYKKKNKNRIALLKKNWAISNNERKKISNYKWFSSNKEKAHKSVQTHRLNNIKFYRYKRAKERAIKKQAMLHGFDEKIKQIYKNCPEGYHVDHVIPLCNPQVCGLHVPWNLQYLPAQENLSKGNKLI